MKAKEQDQSQYNSHDKNDESSSGEGCASNGCGCFGTILVFAAAAILYTICSPETFHLMPGESNMWSDAMEEVFENLDQVMPDSLIIEDSLDPYDHWQEAVNFKDLNLVYLVKPKIEVASMADTSRKYIIEIIARVDHVDANEFEIKNFFVDTLYRRDAPINHMEDTESPWDDME